MGKPAIADTGERAGGDEGGVVEESIRNRWLSPRKTLPMPLMVTRSFYGYRVR
jgi:hypothetical protein